MGEDYRGSGEALGPPPPGGMSPPPRLTSGRVTDIKQAMDLEGKVALVTGGSRGIGRAVCVALAAEGAAVAVNYRSGKEQAEEVAAEIEAAGVRAVTVAGDVSDYGQAQTMVQETIDELGGLHILVNNAGIAKRRADLQHGARRLARRDARQLRRRLQLHEGGDAPLHGRA